MHCIVRQKLSYNDILHTQSFVSKNLVQKPSFPVTLTKGGSWAMSRKSAVKLTTLAHPFCVNQAEGDLPRHFHFMGEYSKLDRVKMMGTHEKINAIWWNIKINLQKLIDICGYELPTNLQNFTQNDLTEVKIFHNVLGGGYFSWNTLYRHTAYSKSGKRSQLINNQFCLPWGIALIDDLKNIPHKQNKKVSYC